MSSAAELRFIQLGALSLRLNALDVDQVISELLSHQQQAPDLMTRARLVLDVSQLGEEPFPASDLGALAMALKEHDLGLVGVVAGGQAAVAASTLNLPVLRSVGEIRLAAADARRAQAKNQPAEAGPSEPPAIAADTPDDDNRPTRFVDRTIRSGQQVYARDADLVVVGSVSPGAEIIADGSIHVYGTLRGRALAGATGDEQARVFCRDFQAELVSVAGHYKILEALPDGLKGGAVQVWLQDGKLKLDPLD
ncbi:MAG: septum site-determining protein MinC [Wenzhouxiangella sp.]